MIDEPVPLRRSLDSLLKHFGVPNIDVASSLRDRWPQIVGPGLAEATRPIELIDGVLVVGCDDPAWASQIGWMERQIGDRLVEHFPDVELRRITTRCRPAP